MIDDPTCNDQTFFIHQRSKNHHHNYHRHQRVSHQEKKRRKASLLHVYLIAYVCTRVLDKIRMSKKERRGKNNKSAKISTSEILMATYTCTFTNYTNKQCCEVIF